MSKYTVDSAGRMTKNKNHKSDYESEAMLRVACIILFFVFAVPLAISLMLSA